MSATASPSVSILNSYSPSGAKGSVVVGPGGFTKADGCTFIIRIDLRGSPGLGKAYRSVRSRRASVSSREAKVRTGIMVRHGSTTPLISISGRAAELTHVVSQPIFNVAWFVKATPQQFADSGLA